MLRILGGALGLALCASGLAAGQEVTAERPAPGTTEMRRVSQILGSTVKLDDGRGYGKVEDIMLGPDNRIEYLVVSHDEQYAMLPWSAGEFNADQRVVTYTITPQALQPVLFAPNAWPTGPAYFERVRTVFPRAAARGAPRFERKAVTPDQAAPGGAVVVPPGEKVKVKRDGKVKAKP